MKFLEKLHLRYITSFAVYGLAIALIALAGMPWQGQNVSYF